MPWAGSNRRPISTPYRSDHLSYTTPYIVCLDRGSCRCQTLPKILGYSLMTYSEPRSICTFCLNSAFLRLIRLSFSPTLPSALHYYLPALLSVCRGQLVADAGFGNYLVASGCTYGFGYRLFPLLQFFGLFRCRFDSVQRTGFRPGCLHCVGDLNK